MHHRLAPKVHRFWYKIFMFYVDLDELDELNKRFWFISRNRFNVFSFWDKDHLEFPKDNPVKNKTIKENILTYLRTNGIEEAEIGKIMLLTNFKTLGYQFNPVSFYFCFDKKNQPLCAVIEIGNTFLEQKPFFLSKENFKNSTYHLRSPKYFYVSPFIAMDDAFDFNLEIPNEKLLIKIDDYDKEGKRFFLSTLSGKEKKLSNAALVWYAIRFPFITLQVIGLIHWQAFKLWAKGLKYYKKSDHPELQQEIYKPHKG